MTPMGSQADSKKNPLPRMNNAYCLLNDAYFEGNKLAPNRGLVSLKIGIGQ
jgi:hypothetical protein